MLSMVGVGITPPKVLGTPKPASSVMISSTLGAPLGGTTRGAHQGVDCRASFLITPPKAGAGGGSCSPLMVVVAPGDPMTPVTCTALGGAPVAASPEVPAATTSLWPISMVSELSRLAAFSAATVVPKRSAMVARSSPATTA
jgi:hypothetical protein